MYLLLILSLCLLIHFMYTQAKCVVKVKPTLNLTRMAIPILSFTSSFDCNDGKH